MTISKLTIEETKTKLLETVGEFYQAQRILKEQLEKQLKRLFKQSKFRCPNCSSKKNLLFDGVLIGDEVIIYARCLNCKRLLCITENSPAVPHQLEKTYLANNR